MLGPQTILAALTDGVMKAQGSTLTDAEKRSVAEAMGGGSLDAAASEPPPLCPVERRKFDPQQPSRLEGWGMTLEGTRFVSGDIARLAASDVPRLDLDWAFAFPGASRARSQPTVAGGSIFVGSQDGTVYALDFATGCVRWSFKADAEVRSSFAVEPWAGGTRLTHRASSSVTSRAMPMPSMRSSGALIWKHRIDSHERATITGSPRYYAGRLYVPMSSSEWAAAADPTYECCTFRGGVVALDAATGSEIWKAHTIEQPVDAHRHEELGRRTAMARGRRTGLEQPDDRRQAQASVRRHGRGLHVASGQHERFRHRVRPGDRSPALALPVAAGRRVEHGLLHRRRPQLPA